MLTTCIVLGIKLYLFPIRFNFRPGYDIKLQPAMEFRRRIMRLPGHPRAMCNACPRDYELPGWHLSHG